MTNEEMLVDLKQFITATISQQTVQLATKDDLREEISKLENRVDARFDEVLDAIGETLTVATEDLDNRVTGHDKRIGRLELHSV